MSILVRNSNSSLSLISNNKNQNQSYHKIFNDCETQTNQFDNQAKFNYQQANIEQIERLQRDIMLQKKNFTQYIDMYQKIKAQNEYLHDKVDLQQIQMKKIRLENYQLKKFLRKASSTYRQIYQHDIYQAEISRLTNDLQWHQKLESIYHQICVDRDQLKNQVKQLQSKLLKQKDQSQHQNEQICELINTISKLMREIDSLSKTIREGKEKLQRAQYFLKRHLQNYCQLQGYTIQCKKLLQETNINVLELYKQTFIYSKLRQEDKR